MGNVLDPQYIIDQVQHFLNEKAPTCWLLRYYKGKESDRGPQFVFHFRGLERDYFDEIIIPGINGIIDKQDKEHPSFHAVETCFDTPSRWDMSVILKRNLRRHI